MFLNPNFKICIMGGKSFEALKRKWGSVANSKMGLIEKIKKVMFSPSEFFERIKTERGIGEAFKFLAILSLINLVINIILFQFDLTHLSFLSSFFKFLGTIGAAVLGIIISIAIYIGSLVFSFIWAGFIHLFAKLFGGKSDYSATYKALTYASTPTLIFGWLPWIGLIFGLYTFYLSIKGISRLHGMSMGRSFVIVFVPPIVLGSIIMALSALVYIYFVSLFVGKVGGPGGLGPTTKLIEVVSPPTCLADGTANIIVRNIGTTPIKSSDISVTKDGSPLTYGQFTVDKATIEPGSFATIKAPCTTPRVPKSCIYTIEGMQAIVFCV